MAQLTFQVAGVLVLGLALWRVAARAGLPLPLPGAVALTIVVFLGVQNIGNVRESWHTLDLHREHSKGVTARAGQDTCTAVGVDRHFLGWVGARIPLREPYYMVVEDRLRGAGDICIRQLLFPRVQKLELRDARYVVFWGKVDRPLLADLRRRGLRVEAYPKREHLLVHLD